MLFVKFGSDENNTIDMEDTAGIAVQRKPEVHMAVSMKTNVLKETGILI